MSDNQSENSEGRRLDGGEIVRLSARQENTDKRERMTVHRASKMIGAIIEQLETDQNCDVVALSLQEVVSKTIAGDRINEVHRTVEIDARRMFAKVW